MVKMFGRTVIYSNEDEINSENVVDAIGKAMPVHNKNVREITYLYNYYKGDQPVFKRKKEIRPEIKNFVVENRANEIVSFKTGYLIGEPIQYVSKGTDEAVIADIMKLGGMMEAIGKPTLDKELVEWFYISGTAYRIVMPEENKDDEDNNAFRVYSADPREAFVIYSSNFERKPLAGCCVSKDKDGNDLVTVYTPSEYFVIKKNEIADHRTNDIGLIPIIEYPANSARLGAFEIVLTVLDSINEIESNRIDAIQQYVQAFMKFVNCDISLEQFEDFKKKGAIKVFSENGMPADVDIVSKELSQTQTQVIIDYMYQSVLTICGMPNRNGGNSSTSDTGAATVLRDGWHTTEGKAKADEMMFRKSEKEMLKVVLAICKNMVGGIRLKSSDIDIKFTRRNYENIEIKSQVLISMLNNDKIHPKLAYEHSGMFSDPENAYQQGMKYYEKVQKEMEMTLEDDSKKKDEKVVKDVEV